MDDFWKDAVAANISRGFKLISNENGVAESGVAWSVEGRETVSDQAGRCKWCRR
jgi:hypothetical protein